MEAKKVKLIRHAESTANKGIRADNPITIPLSEVGKSQAERLAEILDISEIVIVSKFERTTKTATPFLEKNKDIPIIISPDTHEFICLREERFIEAKNLDEIDILVEKFWSDLDPNYKDSQATESFYEFVERVHLFLLSLKDLPYKSIHIFSHEQFIKMAIILVTNFPNLMKNPSQGDIKEFMKFFSDNLISDKLIVPNASIHELSNQINDYIFLYC